MRIDFDHTTWQGQEDSNPRPTVLETGTLPAELYPYVDFVNTSYYITLFAGLQVFFEKKFLPLKKSLFDCIFRSMGGALLGMRYVGALAGFALIRH